MFISDCLLLLVHQQIFASSTTKSGYFVLCLSCRSFRWCSTSNCRTSIRNRNSDKHSGVTCKAVSSNLYLRKLLVEFYLEFCQDCKGIVLVPVFPPNLQSEERENETRGAPTMRLSVTNWQIMCVDPNKVAPERGHTCSTIEWKKGSVDSMIGIMQ